MLRSLGDDFQDQHVECPLNDVGSFSHLGVTLQITINAVVVDRGIQVVTLTASGN